VAIDTWDAASFIALSVLLGIVQALVSSETDPLTGPLRVMGHVLTYVVKLPLVYFAVTACRPYYPDHSLPSFLRFFAFLAVALAIAFLGRTLGRMIGTMPQREESEQASEDQSTQEQ